MNLINFVKPYIIAISVSLSFVAVFMVAERFWPAEKDQAYLRGAWWNLRCRVVHDVMLVMIGSFAAILPTLIQRYTGTGWIDLGLGNPQTWPQIALAAVTFLFIGDVFQYLWHRLQHRFDFLWATHRLHHSDEALNASTTLRAHWAEAFLSPFVATLPMSILFVPIGGTTTTATWVLLTAVGYWNHANLRINFGPWFVSPAYHRIHHSVLRQHQNKNLAGAFPILDIVGGTYWRPRPGEFPGTGLYEGQDRNVLAANLMFLTLWWDQIKRSSKRR